MTFDPAVLKDPAALTTDWKPLRPGGANFTGERLTGVDHAGLERLRGEARQLGALIGCPVWDGTQR